MKESYDNAAANPAGLPAALGEAGSPLPPGPLRVGWVAGPATLDEYGKVLQPLAVGLMDELVEVVAFYPSGTDSRELPSPPVEAVSCGRTKWWCFQTRQVETLAGEIRRRKLRLLHALDADAWPLTVRLARLAGLNCVVSSYNLDDARKLGRLGNSAAAVLAASQPLRDALLARHVAAGEHIELVRPGVYQVRGATCFLNPANRVSIVAGGVMDNFAAFAAVVTCFAQLRRDQHDCVLFLLGNGRAEKPLRALADSLGVRAELTFVDRQPPRLLPEIFKAADIYVAPVPRRGIDIAALLAMAGGVPVLSVGSGASDFIIDERTALMFAPANATDLRAKLSALLTDHAAASALAERALAHLRANHSPAGAVTDVARLYRQVAALPTPAPQLQTP